jgi:hypothetical protein
MSPRGAIIGRDPKRRCGNGLSVIFTAIFRYGHRTGPANPGAMEWSYGTALYSIDKAQMLLARQTFADYIMQQFTTPPRGILSAWCRRNRFFR